MTRTVVMRAVRGPNSIRFAAAVLSLSLLAACESINTRSDYDRGFDFSAYDTFSWISAKPMLASTPDVSPLSEGRIQKAITDVLATKGIRFVEDAAAADFVVAFTVGARRQAQVDSTSAYPYPAGFAAPYRWGGPYYQDIDVHEYTQGRLAIDVFDAKTHQPVWHGLATKSITGADQANPVELINKAVALILEPFPPKS